LNVLAGASRLRIIAIFPSDTTNLLRYNYDIIFVEEIEAVKRNR